MNSNVISYRAAVSVAQDMLQKGLISEGEYHQIDRVFRDKYCVKYGTLFAENPLLFMQNRANMSQTKDNGGGRNGEED